MKRELFKDTKKIISEKNNTDIKPGNPYDYQEGLNPFLDYLNNWETHKMTTEEYGGSSPAFHNMTDAFNSSLNSRTRSMHVRRVNKTTLGMFTISTISLPRDMDDFHMNQVYETMIWYNKHYLGYHVFSPSEFCKCLTNKSNICKYSSRINSYG